jgi:hypothetical protein
MYQYIQILVKIGHKKRILYSKIYIVCGILDVSQPYRTPRPVAGIALLFCVLYSLCVMCPLLFV